MQTPVQQRGTWARQASLSICASVKACQQGVERAPATSASAMSSSIVSSLSVSPHWSRRALCPERVPHPVALEEVPDDTAEWCPSGFL